MNPLQTLTDNIKKRMGLKVIKHAVDNYPKIEIKKYNYLKKLSLSFIASSGTLFLAINYLPDNFFTFWLKVLLFLSTLSVILFGYAHYSDHYRNAKIKYDALKDIDNEDDLLAMFNNVDDILSLNEFNDDGYEWRNVDKTLTDEEIQLLLTSKLTKEQREYIKKIIHESPNLTYKHIIQLEKVFFESKDVVESIRNNALNTFLQNKNMSHLDTKEFFADTKEIELKEVELEAEYKRIL